jgi:hypothetical protein
MRERRRSRFPSWHSQTTRTCQPIRLSNLRLSLSRPLFLSNLARQYSRFECGRFFPLRQLCPCQKHPCTKMALLRLGKTRSGFPGRSGTLSRNLYPHERAIFLTISSGFVSLLRMSAMCLLRSRRVNVSMTVRIVLTSRILPHADREDNPTSG